MKVKVWWNSLWGEKPSGKVEAAVETPKVPASADSSTPDFSLPPLPSLAQGAYIGTLDVQSATWLYVKSWAINEICKLRERNDNVSRDLVQTSITRGEIKMLKSLLELGQPPRRLEQPREYERGEY